MTCERCGAEIPDGLAECPNCQPARPSAVPGPTAPAAPPQPPPPYLPYPPSPAQYAGPYPHARPPGKPVPVIILVVLVFVGGLGYLTQALPGTPESVFGAFLTGASAQIVHVLYALAYTAVGVGLLLMSRWGWWLGVVGCAASALSSALTIVNLQPMVDWALQNPGIPPELAPFLQFAIALALALDVLLKSAIIAYLLWKRELFGIDVESAPAARQ